MPSKSRLRQWREDRGLTLEEIADLTGYSVPMLSRVERGKRDVPPMRRVSLARRLGCRIRDLFPPPEDLTISQ